MSRIPVGQTIKQVIIIGGTIAFILWLAYEMAKRYPITSPSHSSPSNEQKINFNG